MNLKYAMRSEDTEQIAVINWAHWYADRYPELKWLHHCPNGGSRNRAEAVKLKQMGVKAGVADLCLPYPKGIYCGLYIEMKFENNRQQDTQKEFLADMAAAGHFVATCYSAEEAIKVIEEYVKQKTSRFYIGEGVVEFKYSKDGKSGILTDSAYGEMSIPNNSILKGGKIKEGGAKK